MNNHFRIKNYFWFTERERERQRASVSAVNLQIRNITFAPTSRLAGADSGIVLFACSRTLIQRSLCTAHLLCLGVFFTRCSKITTNLHHRHTSCMLATLIYYGLNDVTSRFIAAVSTSQQKCHSSINKANSSKYLTSLINFNENVNT